MKKANTVRKHACLGFACDRLITPIHANRSRKKNALHSHWPTRNGPSSSPSRIFRVTNHIIITQFSHLLLTAQRASERSRHFILDLFIFSYDLIIIRNVSPMHEFRSKGSGELTDQNFYKSPSIPKTECIRMTAAYISDKWEHQPGGKEPISMSFGYARVLI